jgi:hypothetical protein
MVATIWRTTAECETGIPAAFGASIVARRGTHVGVIATGKDGSREVCVAVVMRVDVDSANKPPAASKNILSNVLQVKCAAAMSAFECGAIAVQHSDMWHATKNGLCKAHIHAVRQSRRDRTRGSPQCGSAQRS